MINTFTMNIGDFGASQFFKLFDGADTDDLFKIIRNPKRNRRSPVSVSGNAPIIGILEPISESLVLDVVRNPISLIV